MDGILYCKIKRAWSLTGLEELGMSIQFLLILLGGSITSIYKKLPGVSWECANYG